MRPIRALLRQRKKILGRADRSTILIVVYTAFSEGVVAGIWHQVGPLALAGLLLVNLALFFLVFVVLKVTSRRLGFSREDQVAIIFCGSKKSLASGVPMAGVLFPAATAGLALLPLMLFHQIQLMACAVIAQRYAARPALAKEPVLA